MTELGKDRTKSATADVDLQYLQDELETFKERQRKEMDEVRRLQLAQISESTLENDEGTEIS